MCESNKCNLWRPVELIVQVIVFKEILFLIRVAAGITVFSVKTAVTTLIPSNYFAILYCVVFILSPFLNCLINTLSEKSFRTLLLISLGVFAVVPTIVDVLGELRGEQFIGLSTVGMYGSQWGYSSINFILMYFVGAYLKKGNSWLLRRPGSQLKMMFIINVLLITAWARVNDTFGYFTERSAWEYCNPLIIGGAVLAFILFKRVDLGVNRVVNILAEGTFTVFLLHSVFLPYLQIERFVKGNTFLMVLHIMGSVVGLYMICWCIHVVYRLFTYQLFTKLSEKTKQFTIIVESRTGV